MFILLALVFGIACRLLLCLAVVLWSVIFRRAIPIVLEFLPVPLGALVEICLLSRDGLYGTAQLLAKLSVVLIGGLEALFHPVALLVVVPALVLIGRLEIWALRTDNAFVSTDAPPSHTFED
jgi:hypothetical protein